MDASCDPGALGIPKYPNSHIPHSCHVIWRSSVGMSCSLRADFDVLLKKSLGTTQFHSAGTVSKNHLYENRR